MAAAAANGNGGAEAIIMEAVLPEIPDFAFYHVAWSPNGSRLATSADDSSARVWKVAPRAGGGWLCTATLEGHTEPVLSVAWSPDGTRMATSSMDKTAKIWDPMPGGGSWQCTGTLEGHSEGVEVAAWSPDGAWLATCSYDGTARVWEGGSWRCSATLEGHIGCVTWVAWSPDGSQLGTGGVDTTVRVWEVAAGGDGSWRSIATLDGHTGWVNTVAWSPDGVWLATAANDSTVKLWEAVPGGCGSWRCTATLEGHDGAVSSVAWSPDGFWLASSSSDKTTKVWEKERNSATMGAQAGGGWRCAATLENHSETACCAAWSPDGTRLATCSHDGTARVWRLPTPMQRAAAPQPPAAPAAEAAQDCPPQPVRSISPAQLDAALGATRRPLGGGSSSVFRGTLDGAPVAVKLLDPQGLQARRGEHRAEVELLSRLRHRHIVQIYAGCEERQAVVMELMEGGTLQEVLREGRTSWEVRLRMLYEACVALLFLHNCVPAILHRDFKPSNIMLSRSGMAKLADIGLAKEVPAGGARIASPGSVVGSLGFMDPRYIQSREYGAASDVYSVGVCILMVLLGRTDPAGIVDEVKDAKLDDEEMNLLDRRPGAGDWDTEKAASLMSLALACAHSRHTRRPSLAEVVEQLGEFKDAMPAQPNLCACGAQLAAGPTISHMEKWLACPITHELMEEPVLAEDGFTYERVSIEAHLRARAVSPMTNLRMGTTVIQNHMVKSLTRQVKEGLSRSGG